MDNDDYVILGYDPWKFSTFGSPDESEIKGKAIEILTDALCGD